jgi:uncharacterized protein (DUF433 family)
MSLEGTPMTSTESHIAFRTVEEKEAYIPGTGLAVWEIAWIARYRDGDAEAVADDLGIDCALVRAALDYAAEHYVEIELQIHQHVSWTEEEIRRLMPGARAVSFDPDDGAHPTA